MPYTDFYMNKPACDKKLINVLDRLKTEINLKDVNQVASDTANIMFDGRGGIYNGRSYCGVQISIKPQHQTPVKSSKFPYGR